MRLREPGDAHVSPHYKSVSLCVMSAGDLDNPGILSLEVAAAGAELSRACLTIFSECSSSCIPAISSENQCNLSTDLIG